MYGRCRGGGGWILGHLIDGIQAEWVRVLYADLSMHPLPAAVDSTEAVLLADIFPTSYEVDVFNGITCQSDRTVRWSPPGHWTWPRTRRLVAVVALRVVCAVPDRDEAEPVLASAASRVLGRHPAVKVVPTSVDRDASRALARESADAALTVCGHARTGWRRRPRAGFGEPVTRRAHAHSAGRRTR
jgi:hypothetical protein